LAYSTLILPYLRGGDEGVFGRSVSRPRFQKGAKAGKIIPFKIEIAGEIKEKIFFRLWVLAVLETPCLQERTISPSGKIYGSLRGMIFSAWGF
jgi:hypothetical protein